MPSEALVKVAGQLTDTSVNPDDTNNPFKDVIIPPPGIRDIINKTAAFVAQNGVEFEQRMMREPNAKDRFAFLFQDHPYRTYYNLKVKLVQEGNTGDVEPSVPQPVADMWKKKQEQMDKATTHLMLKNVSEEQSAQTLLDLLPADERDQPPPKLRFKLSHPTISPSDLDVMKLTARFAAVNGQAFLSGLLQRERGNPQLEFLKPHHPNHAYFRALIDSYAQIIHPSRELERMLRIMAGRETSTGEQLESDEREEWRRRYLAARMLKRYKCQKELDEKRREQEEAEAEERSAMAAINWEDFIIVETLTFTEADKAMDLPSCIRPAPHVQEAPLILDSSKRKLVTQPPAVEPTPPPSIPQPQPAAVTTKVDGNEQKIVLRPDYVRRGKRSAAGRYLKCPISGQLVLPEEMTAHLRVLLLDSKWKDQREALLARARAESVFAPDVDIESNIANFVMKRPDLFGTVEDEILEHTADSSNTTTSGVAPPASRPGAVIILPDDSVTTTKRARLG